MVMAESGVSRSPVDVLWLTNIPTPYRHARFRLLSSALATRGRSFFVVYMAGQHANRFWSYEKDEAPYPHTVLRGISFRVRSTTFHFNPSIDEHLRSGPRLVVVGGVHNPTAWYAMMARRESTRAALMVESNLDSEKRTRGVAAAIKTWMIGRADAYVVPGQASLPYLTSRFAAAEERPTLLLPNIIDEASFPERGSDAAMLARKRLRSEWGISEGERVIVIPARLEAFKGIPDLVLSLNSFEAPLACTFVFAGEGSLRRDVEELASRHRIRVLGQLPSSAMGDLYAASDVMLLPSRRDPSPVSVVEAIRCGLPVALSTAVGNSKEALVANKNGWSFEPADVNALANILRQVCTVHRTTLDSMGRYSAEVYETRFQSHVVVDRVASGFDELLTQDERDLR